MEKLWPHEGALHADPQQALRSVPGEGVRDEELATFKTRAHIETTIYRAKGAGFPHGQLCALALAA